MRDPVAPRESRDSGHEKANRSRARAHDRDAGGRALLQLDTPGEPRRPCRADRADALFLIYAVPGQGGEAELSELYFDSAREPKEIWLVPGAGHTGGIEAQPDEYERRVVGFFDDALLGTG